MSYAAHRLSFGADVIATAVATAERRPAATTIPAKAGLFQRLGDAISLSRQRQADREIAAYLARSGGLITDSVERDIQRFISPTGWSPGRRS